MPIWALIITILCYVIVAKLKAINQISLHGQHHGVQIYWCMFYCKNCLWTNIMYDELNANE